MKKYIPFIFAVMLSACSSGGSISPAPDQNPDPPPAPDEMKLPTSGTASYTGQMSVTFTRTNETQARASSSPITLNVDFGAASSQVTGSAQNFSGLEGKLELERGTLDRNAATGEPDFSGVMSGSLKEGTQTYTLSANANGTFSANTQSAVSGSLQGTVLQRGQVGSVSGEFQAAKIP